MIASVLCDLIYMAPLSVLALYFSALNMGEEWNWPVSFLVAIVTAGICLSFRYLKGKYKYLPPGAAVVTATCVILMMIKEDGSALLWQNRYIFLAILVTFVCFLAGRLMASYKWPRRGMTLALFGFLVTLVFTGASVNKGVAAIAFLPLLASAASDVELFWGKSGYTDPKGHLVSITPFLIAICLLVFAMPAPKEPFSWNFVSDIWEKTVTVVKSVGNLFHDGGEDYGAFIGFSDNGGFFGTLGRRPKEVLRSVETDIGRQALYLAGKTFDTFDGREWTASYSGENSDRVMDTMETLAAASTLGNGNIDDYLRREEIRLKYLDIKTRYLFTPLKPLFPERKSDNPQYVQDGADLLAKEQLKYGSVYDVYFYHINRDLMALLEMTCERGPLSRDEWEGMLGRYGYAIYRGGNDSSKASYEDYLRYRERVYSYYLPETGLSDRMKEYIRDEIEDRALDLITEASKDNPAFAEQAGNLDAAYGDICKLNRLEELLSGFDYTTEQAELPSDIASPSDFLDYFMLKGRRGYCTHFATAFVLIARHMGIPCRYVQGYCVKKPETGFTVTSDMAHAWPEAYIDGFGWLPFEPTPGKRRFSGWAIRKEAGGISPDLTAEPHEQSQDAEEAFNAGEEEKESHAGLKVVLISVLASLIFIALFFLLDYVITRRRYERMPDDLKAKALFKRNLKLLGFLGYEICDGETLEELRTRCLEGIPCEALSFICRMELIQYADASADALLLRDFIDSEKALWALLNEKKGKRALLYRLRLR